MQTLQLFYDNVVNVVFDNYGNKYEVKEAKGNWKYINHNNKKVSISSLQEKPLIQDFDDVVFHYRFGWHREYPCPAIGYFVYRKITGEKISLKEFFKQDKSY